MKMLFVVAAMFLEEIREIVRLKINRKGEFFSFPLITSVALEIWTRRGG
jgi:hypothetical protein